MPVDLTRSGLERFVDAQDSVFADVCDELKAGKKTSHWVWFIFPQLKGLGRSAVAQHFGIESKEEALAYWHHPVLGARLRKCTQLVLAVNGRTAHEIFGSPDDLKFRSCMTLFARVTLDEPAFQMAVELYFDGQPDEGTLALI